MGVITDKDITICGHGSNRPSIKNLHTYASTRYSQIAGNGVHKGIVAVRRFKKLTKAGRVKFHDTYKVIVGRNYYSQSLRGYVFKPYSNGRYYSDCSSSGMATLKQIGYNVGSYLLNTAGIYTNDTLFEDVDVTIKAGHIMNPEVLEVGDAILFAGNDPSRPKQIGHVEWVYVVPAKTTTTTTKKESSKKAYTGTYPTLPKSGSFVYGDGMSKNKSYKKDIKLMQKLINWINGEKIDEDGEFGKVTQAAVKRAQKFLGVTVDGRFGPKTLAAAKDYKK